MSNPFWSPDAQKIIYVQEETEINYISISDYRHKLLINTLHNDIHFNYEIYIMNADSSGRQRSTHSSADEINPEWSPAVK